MTRFLVHSVPLLSLLILTVSVPAEAGIVGWLGRLSGPGPFDGRMWSADIACFGRSERPSALVEARDVARALLESTAVTLKTLETSPPLDVNGTLNTQLLSLSKLLTIQATSVQALDAAIAKADVEIDTTRGCRLDRANVVASIHYEGGRWDDTPDDYSADTKLRSYLAIVYIPVPRFYTRGDLPRYSRAIEVGIGGGAYQLTGSTIRDKNLWRGVVPLRLRMIPSEILWEMARDGAPMRYDTASWKARVRRALQSIQYRVGADWVLGEWDPEPFTVAKPSGRNELVPTHGFEIDLGLLARALRPGVNREK